MYNPIDISIIILTYNGKLLLSRTLDSVSKSDISGLNIETIVADNGSTDGALEMVRERYPWVKVVDNKSNLGFSAGNNRGVAFSSGRYVLFLNSDTELFPETLKYVYSRMETDNEIGASTCRVELQSGEIDPASHRGFPTPWRSFCYYLGLENLVAHSSSHRLRKIFGGYHLLDQDLNVEHEIESCTGAFMLVQRSVGDALGWWDEEFFMYGEDLDFCFRIKETGKKILFFPQVRMLHLKHQSGLKKQVLSEEAKKIKRRTVAAFYDSMKIFYRKHYESKYPFLVMIFVLFFVWIKKNISLLRIS